jgi:hypothetical protein
MRSELLNKIDHTRGLENTLFGNRELFESVDRRQALLSAHALQ